MSRWKKWMLRLGTGLFAVGLAALLAMPHEAMRTAVAATAKATPTPVPSNKHLSSLTAVYTGGPVMVGQSLDLKKLTVMGLYTDGSYETITGYKLSSNNITAVGRNVIRITYDGQTVDIEVVGRKVNEIFAYYKDAELTVGDQIVKSKIVAWVTYSDGEAEELKDYNLVNDVVKTVGTNVFYLTYEGVSASFSVIGKEIRLAKSISAYYKGPDLIVGQAPKRSDFLVSITYNDMTVEEITNFEVVPSVVQKEGQNKLMISSGELTTEVKITGIAKQVVKIKAEYTGFPLVIGTAVNIEDIKVTAEFNDGSKDEVKNFTLSNPVVYTIGDNVISVYVDKVTADILVRGVEAEIVDYDNAYEKTLKDGKLSTTIRLAANSKADKSMISIERLSSALVKKAMRRIVNTDKYMAFEVSFEDPDLAEYLPMTMRLTVPQGYDKDNFAVFYTTNRKTIMAQMNGTFLQDGTYEFKMFQPGTYVIADCTKLIYVDEILLEKKNVTLAVGKSYSIKATVYPFDATNKELKYTSSRPDIAEVDENGLVTAKATGTTVISVESTDGSDTNTYFYLRVKKK